MKNRYKNRTKSPWPAYIAWGLGAALIAMSFIGCSSEPTVVSTEKVWNVDEPVHNAFWRAVKQLEKHGCNLDKLQSESLNVYMVEEFPTATSSDMVAAKATWIWKDGINIQVLERLWEPAQFTHQDELAQKNMITMLHEIGHDYFNLSHHEGEWDVMNATISNGKISQEDLSRSINRMLFEGRKIYDSLSLQKRF